MYLSVPLHGQLQQQLHPPTQRPPEVPLAEEHGGGAEGEDPETERTLQAGRVQAGDPEPGAEVRVKFEKNIAFYINVQLKYIELRRDVVS